MKKVLSLILAITLVMTVIASVSVQALTAEEITFVDTTATVTAGWGAASTIVHAADKKSFTMTSTASSTGYRTQIQCLINVQGLSGVVSKSAKVGIDLYPTFKNQNGVDKCYAKYSLDKAATFSNDFANPLTSGEKYTLVIPISQIPSDCTTIQFQFQNFGNQLSDDTVIIGSAPYVYEAGDGVTVTTTTTSSQNPSSTTSSQNPTQSTIAAQKPDPSTITFPETVVKMTKGWESECTLAVSANMKYCTVEPYKKTSGYITQFQCYLNLSKFSDLLSQSSIIAFDIYPTFTNKNGVDKCYMKYSFDNAATFSGDYSNQLDSNEKYVAKIDVSTIKSTSKSVQFQFQNYGNQIADDAYIIISAPYCFEASPDAPTPVSTTTTTVNNNPEKLLTPPELDTSKPYFKIGNAAATVGSTAQVPVTIGNNPGIFSAMFSIAYDNAAFTFKGVKAGNVFSTSEFYAGAQNGVVNVALGSIDLVNNNTKNGTAVILEFKVNESAPVSNYVFSFTNYDAEKFINTSAENVAFTFGKGIVGVREKPQVLAAPASIAVTQNSNKKATVVWSKVAGAKGYQLFRKTGNGAWTSFKTLVGNINSYADSSLAAGKTYYYKVRAFSETLISNYTAQKAVTTYKIAKVGGVKIKVSGKKVTVKWNKTANAKKYYVYTSLKKKSGFKKVKTVSSNKVTLTLKAKKTYYIKVKAVKTVGTSKQVISGGYSKIATAKTK